jgi:methylmalonyl-CoA mutase N-terminal domain/subunit
VAAGLDVDEFAPRLSFFFNVHNNFVEEVAKFRAARTLWAKIMRDRFGVKNPKSQMLRFHTQTARRGAGDPGRAQMGIDPPSAPSIRDPSSTT